MVIDGIKGLQELVGREIGVSDWLQINGERIAMFADATSDHQWIHLDEERAKNGPFGGPIAHGYLTLSLGPHLLRRIWRVDGLGMSINYGLNRVRFPSPVPVRSRLRLRAELRRLERLKGAVQVALGLTFEIEGSRKPACVAEALFRYYLGGSTSL